MFGMLSVLAELQRELIVANTRDGLAAARARGRRGGRPPKLTPTRPLWPNGCTTPGSTPSPRSPGCSVFPAAPSTATSTKPPSVPGPTPRRQLRHRHRPVPKPRPILIGPSTGTPMNPRQHPDHPGRARAAGTNPPPGRKPPHNAPIWPSPGSAPTPTGPGDSSPDNTAATANPTDPWSTSRVRCVVMDPSSPATSPPRRSTPAPHRNPCSSGWPPTAGNSPRSCCVPTTERSPHRESSCWSRAHPREGKTLHDDG